MRRLVVSVPGVYDGRARARKPGLELRFAPGEGPIRTFDRPLRAAIPAVLALILAAPAAQAETRLLDDDRPPAVTITSPGEGAAIDPRFAPRITADASDDRGVARVDFLDDGRLVCTDETAPYECDYTPRAGDVGRNTLIAIAVDGTGQIAVDFRAVRLGRFTPRLTAKTTPKRDRRRPYRYATKGSVVLPSGVSGEEACASGGTVSVEITAGRLKLPLTALLKPDCTYRTSIAFPSRRPLGRGGRLTVKTRFGGNEVLSPARARSRRVRAG